MPNYPFTKQVKIIIAATTLYNNLRRHAQRDLYFDNIESNYGLIFNKGIVRENVIKKEYHNSNALDHRT